MLKISLVSYLNTKPFIEGLNHEFGPGELELDMKPPAECAEALRAGKCDLALLPCGSLTDFRDLEILKDYCIGADGPVDSVFLFSHVPADQISRVRLDPHSRTSNLLTRILFRRVWRHKPEWQMPSKRDFSKIKGKTAGVSIGDAAFRLRDTYPYVYDLSGIWKEWSGLPFVFAVWAAPRKSLNKKTKARLNRAFRKGMGYREASAVKYGQEFGYTEEEVTNYLMKSISYPFDDLKHQAFRLYFQEILSLDSTKFIPEPINSVK